MELLYLPTAFQPRRFHPDKKKTCVETWCGAFSQGELWGEGNNYHTHKNVFTLSLFHLYIQRVVMFLPQSDVLQCSTQDHYGTMFIHYRISGSPGED